MKNRTPAGWGMGALATLIGLLAATSLPAAEQTPKNWKMPRTAHGHPDLQGVWTNVTITPLERPKEFPNLVLTDAEAKAIEAKNDQFNEESDAPTDPKTRTQDLPASCGLGFTGADCGYNNFWIDRGREVITVNGEQLRAAGHPRRCARGREEQGQGARGRRHGEVEDQSFASRCIRSSIFTPTSGLPPNTVPTRFSRK
jgi:hypothetical protein